MARRKGSAAAFRRAVSRLDFVGLALVLWALFWPYPHGLCIAALIAAPIVAIVLAWRSGGAISLNERRGQARPQLGGLLFGPWPALGYLGLSDFQMIDWVAPAVLAVLVAAALVYAATRVEAEFRKVWWSVLLLVFASMWGWGLVSEANGYFDRTPVRELSATIVSRWISHGRSTSHYLNVGRSLAPEIEGDISVSRALYDATAVGRPLCFSLYGGTFGWRWHRPHVCGVASAP